MLAICEHGRHRRLRLWRTWGHHCYIIAALNARPGYSRGIAPHEAALNLRHKAVKKRLRNMTQEIAGNVQMLQPASLLRAQLSVPTGRLAQPLKMAASAASKRTKKAAMRFHQKLLCHVRDDRCTGTTPLQAMP